MPYHQTVQPEQSGSSLSTAALTICSYVPYVLMSIFAGALTDRFNKKKTVRFLHAVPSDSAWSGCNTKFHVSFPFYYLFSYREIISYVPYVLMSIFAGALTDRFNKKKTMLVCDVWIGQYITGQCCIEGRCDQIYTGHKENQRHNHGILTQKLNPSLCKL